VPEDWTLVITGIPHTAGGDRLVAFPRRGKRNECIYDECRGRFAGTTLAEQYGQTGRRKAQAVNPMVAVRARATRQAVSCLSARQREVLALMAEGASNAAIARALSITERAVVRHSSNIYDQLGLWPSEDEHRRVVAVLCYLAAS